MLSYCTSTGNVVGCNHKFCEKCFRLVNKDLISNLKYTFNCPCCHASLFVDMKSIEEAVLIGEAATIRIQMTPQLLQLKSTTITFENIICINDKNIMAIEKLEVALQFNITNFNTLYSLFCACRHGHTFLIQHDVYDPYMLFYTSRLVDYAFILLDHSAIPEGYEGTIRGCCYYQLACIFYAYNNNSVTLKYSKLAYEYCLRSTDQTNLSSCKALYLQSQAAFAKLPPLRFAVGDEVEFLHELETGSEWKLGKVVELYYRERDFAMSFTSPYRLQLLDDTDSIDQPPVYAWVKADIDRYVRKVGVRLLQDTRYQARLEAKVAELAVVFRSQEFIQSICDTLASDRAFVDMLQSVWQVDRPVHIIRLYHMFVMYRQPFVHTDSGYHVSTFEEVVAELKAYFDPAHLNGDEAGAAPTGTAVGKGGEDRYLQQIRADILRLARSTPGHPATDSTNTETTIDSMNIPGTLFYAIRNYLSVVVTPDYFIDLQFTAGLNDKCDFTVLLEVSTAISQVSSVRDLLLMRSELISTDVCVSDRYSTKLYNYVTAWMEVHMCLESPNVGTAFECPFIYFFIKFCIEQSLGVPKHALALYDRMNTQLSREFIRCANPCCELNRLDKSTGQVRFKQCGRCRTVIYCSKECQVAHYPDHKILCRKVATFEKGSGPSSDLEKHAEEEDNGEMDRCD